MINKQLHSFQNKYKQLWVSSRQGQRFLLFWQIWVFWGATDSVLLPFLYRYHIFMEKFFLACLGFIVPTTQALWDWMWEPGASHLPKCMFGWLFDSDGQCPMSENAYKSNGPSLPLFFIDLYSSLATKGNHWKAACVDIPVIHTWNNGLTSNIHSGQSPLETWSIYNKLDIRP